MKSPGLTLVLHLTLALGTLHACGQGSAASPSDSPAVEDRPPLEVVNERMSAYNRHDLTAFLSTYADGVEVFTYPDKSLGKGKTHLRGIFEPMFDAGAAQVAVHHQIEKDGYVVNHETVTNGGATTEYVSIYEVRGGLIQSVCFVRD